MTFLNATGIRRMGQKLLGATMFSLLALSPSIADDLSLYGPAAE
ncbi:MAG: transporter substrate-binding protein, partial [Devosia sp.]|nr:transporter substrate-binding protein [Devosia sp.]